MKWHTTDGVSLAFGLFFLGIAGFWLVMEVSRLDAATAAWAALCGLFTYALLGLAGITAAARRRRTEDRHP